MQCSVLFWADMMLVPVRIPGDRGAMQHRTTSDKGSCSREKQTKIQDRDLLNSIAINLLLAGRGLKE